MMLLYWIAVCGAALVASAWLVVLIADYEQTVSEHRPQHASRARASAHSA